MWPRLRVCVWTLAAFICALIRPCGGTESGPIPLSYERDDGGVVSLTVNGTLPTANGGLLLYTFTPPSVASAPAVNTLLTVWPSAAAAAAAAAGAENETLHVQALLRDEAYNTLIDTEQDGTGSAFATGCVLTPNSNGLNYSLLISGPPNVRFQVSVRFTEIDLQINGPPRSGAVTSASTLLYYFDVSEAAYYQWPIHVSVDSDQDSDHPLRPEADWYAHVGLMFIVAPDRDESSVGGTTTAATATTAVATAGLVEVCPTIFTVLADPIRTSRLTFSTTGRLVISPSSSPGLDVGRWYIGVTGLNSTAKEFTLRVSTGTRFASSLPGWLFLLLPLLIAVSTLAITHGLLPFLIRPCCGTDKRIAAATSPQSAVPLSAAAARPEGAAPAAADGKASDGGSTTNVRTITVRAAANTTSGGDTAVAIEPANTTADTTVSGALFSDFSGIPQWSLDTDFSYRAELSARFAAWFDPSHRSARDPTIASREFLPFSFSWHTLLVMCVLFVTTWQIVLSQWNSQRVTGSRDICFYNEKCYNPLNSWDVPFNNFFSNIGYVVLGLAFNLNIVIYQLHKQLDRDCSLFFALGWGMCGEGIFSAMYHVCPTAVIYQFDTAGMFVICSLTMIAVYQTGGSVSHVHAAKYFLFFIVPLLTFNYVGSIHTTDGLTLSQLVGFLATLILWQCAVLAYGYLTFNLTDHAAGLNVSLPDGWSKFRLALFVLFGAGVLGLTVYCVLTKLSVANMLLGELLISAIVMTLRVGTDRLLRLRQFKGNSVFVRRLSVWFLLFGTSIGSWVYALYLFLLPSSRKTVAPWQSRVLNSECYLVDYYDTHDMWHCFSGFGLFFLMLTVFHINPPVQEFAIAAPPHPNRNRRTAPVSAATDTFKRTITIQS